MCVCGQEILQNRTCIRFYLITMTWQIMLIAGAIAMSMCVITTQGQMVRKYGQMCYVPGQCVDHRMMCAKQNETDLFMRCICDRFHVWDADSEVCTESMNTEEMLETLQEKFDNYGHIEKEAKMVFVGVLVAGMFVVCVGVIVVIGCLLYGCCTWRRKKVVIDQPPQNAGRFAKLDPENPDKNRPESQGTGHTGV